MIEKRFQQIKTVHEIALVLLKNEARIEALFTIYFLALLVQALIVRELRLAMKREEIAERHTLIEDGETVEVFEVQFTDLQCQVLSLLGVSERA